MMNFEGCMTNLAYMCQDLPDFLPVFHTASDKNLGIRGEVCSLHFENFSVVLVNYMCITRTGTYSSKAWLVLVIIL